MCRRAGGGEVLFPDSSLLGKGPQLKQEPLVVILAGVAAVGKTTVGRLLASGLGWAFCEGDSLHPEKNIQKMRSGRPLTDKDRRPWLGRIRKVITRAVAKNEPTVLTCSALKREHVRYLLDDSDRVRLIFLQADYPLVLKRLRQRSSHFFPEELLSNQFEILEEPAKKWTVDASRPPEEVVKTIRRKLDLVG